MKNKILLLLLIFYIIINNFLQVFSSSLFKYIINPLIWIIFGTIVFFINKNKKDHPYRQGIIYIIIINVLIYIILFYSLGFVFDYANNPYNTNTKGILINFFSIITIIIIKEYLRNFLIHNVYKNHYFFFTIIILIFILLDLNILMIFNVLKDTNDWITTILKDIIPVLSFNLLASYLCLKSDYLPSSIYKVGITIPLLVIPIIPKYDLIIPTLFDTLIPIFIYVIVKYNIDKQRKETKKISEKPRKWIYTFIITLILLMFALGVFPIKPIVILTGSMKPKINEGDLLIIAECKINDVEIGDIIEYELNGYYVVHRAIKIIKNENRIEIITKGDNNLREDKNPVSEDNLKGCYKYQVPYLGYPAYIFHKIFGNDKVEVETGT